MTPDIPIEAIRDDVRRALEEDVGGGDLTAGLIPEDRDADATVISREAAVICGKSWFEQVFSQLDPRVQIQWQVDDGDKVEPGQVLCRLRGPARSLLTGERTALNFLQTLSATATAANRYVEAVRSTLVKILDTRKTIPGMRQAQKYAVRCGGGTNHRAGLYDGILIKENHIAAAGSVRSAVGQARASAPPGLAVEVEVENLPQVEEALAAGADILLLDNMEPQMLRQAVSLVRGQARLEASGGITLDNVKSVAETGVDYISIGEITKNIRAIDLSMRFAENTIA